VTHPHLAEINRAARDRRALVRAWLPLDVPTFVRQVKALPIFKDCPRSIRQTKVKIVPAAFNNGGRAHGNRFVRIRVTPTSHLAWILETIVHELVHCALPDGVVHNERFRRTLARAARELWGVEFEPNPMNEHGRVLRYALDGKIEEYLRSALDAGLDYPKRTLSAISSEEDIAARRKAETAARVEKRSAHAARMLALAESRLKRAKTLEKKWRLKVRRYERLAAKKGAP
jgi:hypothetical protein